MRVTDKSLFLRMQTQINASRKKLEDASIAVSTGKKVNALEDDPSVLQSQLKHDRQAAELEQSEKGLNRVKDKYKVYETTVKEIYNVMVDLRETMVQLSNPHLSQDVKATLESQLEQIEKHLLALANTQHEEQYIFAGASSGAEAYNENGVYQGDNIELEAEILPGLKITSNITGQAIFGGAGDANGVDVFAMINEMQTMLASGVDAKEVVTGHLNDVDQIIEQTINQQTQIGIRLSSIEVASSTLGDLKMNLAQRRQDIESVDYVTAITEYKAQEYALQAAMQANSNLIKPTLLSYLR